MELHAVQDADRLDAVGAVGVMRCAAFSGVKGRKLLNDEQGDNSAEGHFADKLLLIKDRMKVGRFSYNDDAKLTTRPTGAKKKLNDVTIQ